MRVFTDSRGRQWALEITVASLKRVKAACGADLYALADDGLKPLAALLADVVKLVDVLFVLARDAGGKPPDSDESFAEGLGGDALGNAADAFVDALIDFFPKERARTALQRLRDKSRQVAEALAGQTLAELEAVDPEAVARTIRAGASAGSASSGKSPAASASTPTP
jgi:hypothetical protein